MVTQGAPADALNAEFKGPDGNVFEVPVVVLVDEGSASEEIVSGALKPIAERWWLGNALSARLVQTAARRP